MIYVILICWLLASRIRKHVEFLPKSVWEIIASSWFYYKNRSISLYAHNLITCLKFLFCFFVVEFRDFSVKEQRPVNRPVLQEKERPFHVLLNYNWTLLKTSGVPRGGGGGLGCSTPPSKFRRPSKNGAKLNPIVKTAKNCWIYDANTARCSEKRQ